MAYNLTTIEDRELQELLAGVRPFNFSSSAELSKHIVKHQLCHKYPNISGTVKMEKDGTEWDFKGGFRPDIYKIICDRLKFSGQGTKAKVIGFKPSKPKPKKREDKES